MKITILLTGCLLAGLALLTGCQQDQETTTTREGLAVPIIRELSGQQAPFPDRGFFVVQRPEAWRALWGRTPAPEVDFTQNSVVVALMGQQPTAGYGVNIADVRATGQRINVFVTETRPKPGDTVAQVITYPYAMAVVPKLSQPVAFLLEGTTAPILVVQDELIGIQSRAVGAQTAVIRDQDAWQQFWATNFSATTAAPAIDFTQYMAVSVLAGQKPTGGYSVLITSLEQSNDRLVVNYRLRTPAPGEVVTQAQTSPYAIAIVSASPLPVAFRNVTTPTTVAATTP
ncbi:MAG: protease complex subunit PrcB family protein [Armatimonadota bacterium]